MGVCRTVVLIAFLEFGAGGGWRTFNHDISRSPEGRRVLLAVGDAAFADLYKDTLASVGWRVEVSHDWRATQKLLLDSLPDLPVLDRLPDLNQIHALARARDPGAARARPADPLTAAPPSGSLYSP